MLKKLIFILAIFASLILGLSLTKTSQASVDYHYRYQILTQGSSYEANQDLEIKLYVNVSGEEIDQANVTVNYDSSYLQLNEVKEWNIFDINPDTATAGSIVIVGSSPYQFSGEAPLAYLYFTTLQPIDDLAQILTITSNQITQPTAIPENEQSITPTPAEAIVPPSEPPADFPTSYPTNSNIIANCPVIEGNGSLDLIIIPDSYTNLAEFEQDAKTAVNYLKQTNLPETLKTKFTFRYSTDINKNYEIYIDNESVDINMSLARLTQQDCDGDAFLLISNKYPTVQDSSGTGGFSLLNQMMAVVFKHSLFVTPHELGHGLPGLFDEYDLGVRTSKPSQYENCVHDQNLCQKWQQEFSNDPNIGCFQICGYRNWYRSTQFSAMNNRKEYMNYFNPPSLKRWTEFMNLF